MTVIVVEDVSELRRLISRALTARSEFDVVAEAANGAEAITAAARHHPDLAVLDLGLPDLAGQEVLSRLREVSPAIQIVVYTGSQTQDRWPADAPVDGWVPKTSDVTYLVDLLAGLPRRHETSAVELGPDTADVGRARAFLGDHCRHWGCGDVLADATLVASELVTNALLHADGSCELRVALTDTTLRVQVFDGGAGTPDPRLSDDQDEHGRGLLLVSVLCTAWGVETLDPGGKIVWAELLRSPSGPDPGQTRRSERVGAPWPATGGGAMPPRNPIQASDSPGRVLGRGGRRAGHPVGH